MRKNISQLFFGSFSIPKEAIRRCHTSYSVFGREYLDLVDSIIEAGVAPRATTVVRGIPLILKLLNS